MLLTKNSEKEFAKLPKVEKKKVLKKLRAIEKSPLLGKPLTGELKSFYSVRAWPYRIIYEFDKKRNIIIVHKIQHRQGAYKH
ncbi:MAG: Addiction module toxin, RelE/StbE [Candidatus Woesebacteria bacterium GW2011_GWA1_33_30]|uniref:Addiction module toxin, RelE/StbE n=1 Tax=Candidatus Woesebacteria bacterium GW2011_GWA2_33_28 TaxID=1618561 RepID=A0A0G0A8T1_9BACT|nr:MAG: Addiction module toxin, RelE/StbE [Candidatus Woesebacteria bacterium GW2011_GWA2_33_28]KKP48538.1 MAG: Addiction module toxin, RelE/StbE [Candidatus Woesebacteria bacterium GW2011_GWA1_33_30]KKP49677.1 MAG: Addiction module toxin, RelE/StbE [Microgenomates group bacterium GW2011_GWC1_33_32]KKP52294.1 MAG: Addiction module toxin, RelE/StbE [Candidatus Woesebacteria bacterium GW2011_GWB1_33_38]KKP58125.1 MAG: Addiction module toxin, RelE/StbE [Microgenomates group bacterium GW2011_GWD1_3